jgi:hypothetical protein
VKEHEEDIPTSQQEQKENARLPCENENCYRQRCYKKKTGKGEKKPYRIGLIHRRLWCKELLVACNLFSKKPAFDHEI